MKISPREAVLVMAALSIAVLGVTSFVARQKVDQWKEARKQQEDLRLRIDQDQRLIASRGKWQSELDELSEKLPAFPANKEMDVYWLSVVDAMAERHGVKLAQRKAEEERKHGEVCEMLIECKEWEASLDGLVYFLFDLQTVGAMFDMRQLLVKPKGDGALRGRFSLYCAYTRESKTASP